MGTRTVRIGWAMPALSVAILIAGCESSPRLLPYSDNPLLQSRQPLLKPQGAQPAGPTQLAQSGPQPVNAPPPGLYQQQPPTSLAAARNLTDSSPTAASPYFAASSDTPTGRPRLGPTTNALPPVPPTPAPLAGAAPVASAASVAQPPVASPPPVSPPPMPSPAFTAAPAVVAASARAPDPAFVPVAQPVVQPVGRQAEGRYGHAADYSWLQGELDQHYRGHLELRYRPVSEDDPYGGKVRLADDPRLAEFRPGDIIAVEGELSPESDGTAAAPWAQYRRYQIHTVRLVERK